MLRLRSSVLAAALLAACPLTRAATLSDDQLEAIVDTYAGEIYRTGQTTSLAVGITLGGQTYFKSYGYKTYGPTTPENAVDEHSIFQIGSVTKVWTTALVGRAIVTGNYTTSPINLYTTLGSIPALSKIKDELKPATIGDLASFSAGLPDIGDTGTPDERPPLSEFKVTKFIEKIEGLVPRNYNAKGNPPTSLPAPYFYSDWSTGLLGLIATNDFSVDFTDDAVKNWADTVRDVIIDPLGMTDSFVFDAGPEQSTRLVSGYVQAIGEATVRKGKVTSIDVVNAGGMYVFPPSVTIEQEGASGAGAYPVLENNAVKRIVVTDSGSGYKSAPRVMFTGAGKGVAGQAIVQHGQITGVQITAPGSKCGPTTRIRFVAENGTGAAAECVVAQGKVIAVIMTNMGSGYSRGPTVRIAPGNPAPDNVTAWAAAGGLNSSAADLVKFCQLYLGQPEIGGHAVPGDLARGARYALTPLVPNVPASGELTGMAWDVFNAPIEGGFNAQYSKDGALTGFATYVSLVPSVDLGVVILRGNNKSKTPYTDPIGSVTNSICIAIQQKLIDQE